MKKDRIIQLTKEAEWHGVTKNDDGIIIHLDIQGNFAVVEKQGNDKIIAGYCNVAIIDSDNQYIPPEVLERGLETLLEDDGFYANVMVTHQNVQVGRIIKEYDGHTTHVDDNGLYIVVKIRDRLETTKAVWKLIESGEIASFSIAGEVLGSHEECDGKACWEVIDAINLFEVSLCEIGINKASKFTVVSKSDVCECVCDKSKDNEGHMAKKAKSKTEKQDEPEAEAVEETKAEEVVEDTKVEEVRGKTNTELSAWVEFINNYKVENPDATLTDIAKAWDDAHKPSEEETEKQDEESDMEEDEEEEVEEEEEESENEPVENTNEEAIKSILDAIANLGDVLKGKFDNLSALEDKNEEVVELRKSLAEKDDAIAEMTKRIEVLEKAEEASQTSVEQESEKVTIVRDFGVDYDERSGSVSQKWR